ncbi:hypothetical protein ACQEVY_16140 [Streptomyces sp. CA-288835]|uniref:hypothetical protein n=1 Tax=Streptomyces sp. CA-288835 TaxID=3240069 RepID=UPI003D8DD5AB
MIKSAVRGVAVTALTTTLVLLPTLAQAEETGQDDNERLRLTGVNWLDTTPRWIDVGDDWSTRLQLYTEKTSEKTKKPDKGKAEKRDKKQLDTDQLQYVGDGASECSAVRVHEDEDVTTVTTQCTRTLRLKQGTLKLSDMITYNPEKGVTAKTGIIGGTGQYRSAYGDGTITLDGRYVYLDLLVEE